MAGILFREAFAPGNLEAAWQKVLANNGCAGVDGETVRAFAEHASRRLDRLRAEILAGTYRPQPLRAMHLARKGRRPRTLCVPCVVDRVAQTAAHLALELVFEPTFEDESFGYRRGRSVQLAVERVHLLLHQGYRWVVDADIASFFDEIDHARLLALLGRHVADSQLEDLLRSWLRAEVWDGGERWCLVRGVPQGSPISPLLSNLYLDELDEELQRPGVRLVRYADDFLILCRSRAKADAVLHDVEDLLGELGLRLNRAKTGVVNAEMGFRFLGVSFCPATGCAPEAWGGKSAPRHEGGGANRTSSAVRGEPDHRSLGQADAQALPRSRSLSSDEAGAAPRWQHDPLLRTLYVVSEGVGLRRDGEAVVITSAQGPPSKIPACYVDQVLLLANAHLTLPFLTLCFSHGIPVVLCSGRGGMCGVMEAFDPGPVAVLRAQLNHASDEACCVDLGRAIVRGKIENARVVLRRFARRRSPAAVAGALRQMGDAAASLAKATTLDQVRGIEGNAARVYFASFRDVLDPSWGFTRRVKHPPTDPVNAMLSYGYAVLFNNIHTLVRARGLHPQVGFLHPARPGHAALVSDLIEEFRAIVVDSVVFGLVAGGRVRQEHFGADDAGRRSRLSREGKTILVNALERKLNTPVRHAATGTPLDYRRCIDYQLATLRSFLVGNRSSYDPMRIR